jgi:HK97 family phage prohead protease
MEPQFLRAYVPDDARASVASAPAGTPIRFCASTDLVARDGLTIPVSAWRTADYLANPIVLVNHNFQAMPIGRTVKLEPTDHALYADIEFDQTDPEAKIVESKIRRGFVNSCSVSWDTVRSDGTTVTEASLLDISVVSVPADPRALAIRQKRGLETMARDILALIDAAPESPDPATTTEPPIPNPADSQPARPTWEATATAMVRLMAPFDQRPDGERKQEYAKLARDYARHDNRVPPEFRVAADLDALGAKEIRGLFLAGEPELLPELFAAIETRAGAVLSQRNRDDLGKAIALIQDVLARAQKETKTDDQGDDGRGADDLLTALHKQLTEQAA